MGLLVLLCFLAEWWTRSTRKPVETRPPDPSGRTGERGTLGVALLEDAGNLVVDSVVPGGPAERAGLRRGDVIVTVNRERVSGFDDMMKALQGMLAGDRITLRIRYDAGELLENIEQMMEMDGHGATSRRHDDDNDDNDDNDDDDGWDDDWDNDEDDRDDSRRHRKGHKRSRNP